MSLRNFLTSRVFFKNLIFAIVLMFVIIFIVMQWIKIYTHHGESYAVPDFTGLTGEEIAATATQNNLKYEIIDSVYDNTALPGAVVDQEPEPGFKVKQSRTIFLTINSGQQEKIALPKMTDISFRQAQVLAENNGIVIGNISYEPSEYNDLVLKVRQDSIELKPGDLILKNSAINLVIGRNPGNEDTPLPDLTGVNIEQAKTLLTNSMLNTGTLLYDASITTAKDSINAFVWKQYPSAKNTKRIGLGSSVDLWLTIDSLKITPEIPVETK